MTLGRWSLGGVAIAMLAGYALQSARESAETLRRPVSQSLVGEETRLVPGAVYRPTRVVDAARERHNVHEGDAPLAAVPHLDVVVRGERGEAVPAARLEFDAASSRAVFSDADGRARLAASDLAVGVRLRVSAEGYGVNVSEPALESGGEHVVRLADGAELAGSVAWIDGAPAPAGTTVLAWPSGREPGLAEVARVKRGGFSDDLHVASTDAHGRFRFRGLARSAAYELGAIREGGAVLERARGVVSGRTDLALTLHPLVGAAIELVDRDGGAPRAGDGWFAGSAMWDPVEPHHRARYFPEGAPELAWLGGEALHRVSLGGRDRFLMLYEPHGAGAWSPANGTFSITVPGYEPVWTSVPLAPLSAELAVRELPLERVAESFGSLDLELTGVEGWIEYGARSMPRNFATLRLESGSDAAPLERALPLSADARWHLEGIPSGRYELSLALKDWGTHLPGRRDEPVVVDVGPDGASVSLALAQHGAGEVLVSRADGSDYEGELMLVVQKDGPARFVHFTGAPYVLSGLEEGEYEVSVSRAGGATLVDEPSSRLWLAANTVSACMIHLEQ